MDESTVDPRGDNRPIPTLDVADLASSLVDLPGTMNLRDLAGYPAGERVVGRGRLFRGSVLGHPDDRRQPSRWIPTEAAAYEAIGLRTIIDLRAEREVTATPSAWAMASGAQVVPIPIAERAEGADATYIQQLLSGAIETFSEDDLTALYLDMLDRFASGFADVVAVLAAEELPALLHCSIGKDRTGLAIALVLEVLGTPREIVLEDYALTSRLLPDLASSMAPLFERQGRDPEVARVLFETPRQSMADTLSAIDNRYGGSERFLIDVGGLNPGTPERLRDAVLVAST